MVSADRKESMTVTRSLDKTVVKVVITEDGVTVSYSVKTYESVVAEAAKTAKTARAGAERLLGQANSRE